MTAAEMLTLVDEMAETVKRINTDLYYKCHDDQGRVVMNGWFPAWGASGGVVGNIIRLGVYIRGAMES